MRKVGQFNTCEICNIISDLLRNGRMTYCQVEREVFLTYRRTHLKQQSAEREHLEKVILQCQITGPGGQPIAIMIMPDGMSDWKGNCPINRTGDGGRSSKGSEQSVVKSRIIGVEVVCGNLHKFFLYVTDNFVPGGANCLIEIVRQCLKDIADYCAVNGWKMPKTLHVHADNW